MSTATATAAASARTMTDRAREVLKRAGNPFRNYFARNPDDEVCARYHVPELFAAERDLLLAVIDLYRYDPMTHSEVIPVLGNKGAGKTHLLHSIKHGSNGHWQLLVTPGVFQKDTDFLEYLLFQIIDTLLGGGKQKGTRPLEYIGDILVRRLLGVALRDLSTSEKVELFPPAGLGRLVTGFGFGTAQAGARCEQLAENLSGYSNFARMPTPLDEALATAGITPAKAADLLADYVQRTESHNTAGLMRRAIYQGFARAVLLKDEAEIANFLTYGFAELDFQVRPSRQDLVLALFKVLTDIFRSLKTPVVVAFDQLEDLLLARRNDDGHRTAEAFFAGIVQVMHQIDGLCFLVFAERGLWNRFVPSLDGYIQDRLDNPVHVPKLGTVKAIRLEAPPADLVRQVVEARLRPCLDELAAGETYSDIFPFAEEQVSRVAATEPTLRDMLQQYRHLFDHVVYGPDDVLPTRRSEPTAATRAPMIVREAELMEKESALAKPKPEFVQPEPEPTRPEPTKPEPRKMEPARLSRGIPTSEEIHELRNRIAQLLGRDAEETPAVTFRSVTLVETPADQPEQSPPMLPLSPAAMIEPEIAKSKTEELVKVSTPEDRALSLEGWRQDSPSEMPTPYVAKAGEPAAPEVPSRETFPVVSHLPTAPVVREDSSSTMSHEALLELWDTEQRSARRKLEPDGSVTGATRELQAGLGAFLALCHEHGVKVGPWRLQHVVPEWGFGEHPTYGAVSIAHWACKDGQPWRVAVGLFLARGAGKPKDLEVKFSVMDTQPALVDHLILLRPEDDLAMSGKSKTLWQEAERRGKHARLEPASLDGLALLYSLPRWLAAVREALPNGTPLPNLADVIQEKCEKLLEQVCMPIQG